MRNKYILRNEGTIINWRGNWATGVDYAIGDTINQGGISYICTAPHVSSSDTEPGVGGLWASYWSLFCQGSPGPQGIQGEQGPQGIPGGVMNWRGLYSESTVYALNDGVRSAEGYGYYSLQDDNIGHTPPRDGSDDEYWSCFAWSGGVYTRLDELAAPTDNTNLNVNTSAHGLCPKAPNDAVKALLGDGSWGYPLPDGWIPAGETWTYLSADAPTFTFTIAGDKRTKYYPGMRLKLTHSSTTKYFIITAVSYSNPNTTITVYGGTDYTLSSGTISNPYYSMMKAPAGFPLDPNKWTVQLVDATLKDQQNPTVQAWYNVGSLSLTIPIGIWRVYFFSDTQLSFSSAQEFTLSTTLSTTNNGCSDTDFKIMSYMTSMAVYVAPHTKEKVLNLAAKTVYYLNLMYWAAAGATHLYVNGESAPTIIKAVCSYL